MFFRQLFDRETCTYTYLLADRDSRQAVLIDPVFEQVDRDAELIKQLGFTLLFTLETHVHADHITGGGLLTERLGSQTAVSYRGQTCADLQLRDGDIITFGAHHLQVRATPGHTDSCISFVTDDLAHAFTGDALFVRGCGRTDFQAGDAATLYQSVHNRILSLPDDTLIWPGHDYKGRTCSTVAEEKAFNPRLGGGKTQTEFMAIMGGLKLAPPARIDVAVPGNLCCGKPEKLSG